jgi:hypothetical protein
MAHVRSSVVQSAGAAQAEPMLFVRRLADEPSG